VVRKGSEWAAHGEQEAAAELGLAGAVEDEARMREGEIDRAGEVGHGSALAALDWGSEGVKAAGDGGQWGRRRSGEGSSSGNRKCCGLGCSGE
jgi:hypothetical protein